MSNKDKTREKLLGSMRKTKAVAIPPEGQATEQKPQTVISQAEKKEINSIKTISKKNIVDTSKIDPYQSTDRVWPD